MEFVDFFAICSTGSFDKDASTINFFFQKIYRFFQQGVRNAVKSWILYSKPLLPRFQEIDP